MGNRDCPVCGGRHETAIKRITMSIPREYHLPDAYDVVVCTDCGFVYADTAATVEDYDWYYTHCNFYGDDSKDDNSARYTMTEGMLEEYLEKDSVLLELGAGNGRFTKALKQHGYAHVTGTDPSEESVVRLREAGITAYASNIYDPVLQEEMGKYDGIFLFEVAEHLLLPGKGVENATRRLKENGILLVSVPDYSLIGADESNVPNYFNLEHINYFSETSLDRLMASYGMQRVGQERFGLDLVQAYRKTGAVGIPARDSVTEAAVRAYFSRQQERKFRIKETIGALKEKGCEVVIWGTGSYVMNLFATTDLPQCNIKGFVDNNRLKQGREMYGYRIYPPEYLEDKSYTVLVCSMLYGERIRAQLEGMCTENTAVVL